jgi:hypothetical protein
VDVVGINIDVRRRAIGETLKGNGLIVRNEEESSKLSGRINVSQVLPQPGVPIGCQLTFPGNTCGTRSARGTLNFLLLPWIETLMVMGVSGPTTLAWGDAMMKGDLSGEREPGV